MVSQISVAIRCFPEVREKRKWHGKKAHRERPISMLVIDTETATDQTSLMTGFDAPAWSPHAQTLLFGTARLYRFDFRGSSQWVPVTEFTFFPSYLPEAGVKRLQSIMNEQTIDKDGRRYLADEPTVEHLCLPVEAFLKEFFMIAYDTNCV